MSTVEKLLSKYLQNTERVFAEIKLSQKVVSVDREKARHIIDVAKRYLEDAKYYRDRKRFEIGLVSIAYSEGTPRCVANVGHGGVPMANKGRKEKKGEIGGN